MYAQKRPYTTCWGSFTNTILNNFFQDQFFSDQKFPNKIRAILRFTWPLQAIFGKKRQTRNKSTLAALDALYALNGRRRQALHCLSSSSSSSSSVVGEKSFLRLQVENNFHLWVVNSCSKLLESTQLIPVLTLLALLEPFCNILLRSFSEISESALRLCFTVSVQ